MTLQVKPVSLVCFPEQQQQLELVPAEGTISVNRDGEWASKNKGYLCLLPRNHR